MIRLSLILIDWKVRESFHALEFLARQEVSRDQYEVIWVEHYNHRPEAVADAHRRGLIDQWIVLDREDLYFKHRQYNEGLLAARGELVTVCDSDACFSPRFVGSILDAFDAAGERGLVLYHEEVRSDYRGFHPFPAGTTWDEVMAAPGLMNWDARVGRPRGLTIGFDPLHTLNYGACCTVRRMDAIRAGGFDEHPQYHSFICGPYELGFRLVNRGHRELWHPDEWLLHTWHPWVRPDVDLFGHHDGRNVSSLALEASCTGRVLPYRENDRVRQARLADPEGARVPVPRGDALPVMDPPEEEPPAARRGAQLVNPPRLSRALYLAPFAADDPVTASLEASGLVAELEHFSYDTYVHRFSQDFMEKQLGILCRQFRPEIIIFVPRSDEPAEGSDRVEPSPEVLRTLADSAGAILLTWCAAASRGNAWSPVSDAVAAPLEPGHVAADRSVIAAWPAPDPRLFHPGRDRRHVALVADGPVVVGSAKENLLALLNAEGAGLVVRRLAFRPAERAAVYRRTRIVLNMADGVVPSASNGGRGGSEGRRDGGPPATVRALEAMACGACVVQDAAIPMPPGFHAGRDYLVFASVDEVGGALAAASRPGAAERVGAEGRARVATLASPRPLWTRVLGEAGVKLEGGGAGAVKHWAAASALGIQWQKRSERQKLAPCKRLAIFGAGPSGVTLAAKLRARGFQVVAWIDNAADRQGKLLDEVPIHAPEWLAEGGRSSVDAVVLGFQGRKNPARWQLADLGWTGPVVDADALGK